MGAIRAAENSGGSRTKLAEGEFKNIQALKGIPAEQVIPSMQFIAASLGVECEYCHVAHANEKDDKKPKVSARKMINMMMAITRTTSRANAKLPVIPATEGRPDQSAHLSSLTKGRGPPMKKGRNQRRQKQSYLRQSSSSTNISRPSAAPMLCRKSRAACKRGHSRRSAASISRRKCIPRPRASAFQ